MSRYIKSKKFTGVYFEELENGDKSYCITFKDEHNKFRRIKIGLHSEGIREAFCFNKRNEIVTKLRLGETPPQIIKLKRSRDNLTLDDLAEFYFESRGIHLKNVGEIKQRYDKHKDNLGSMFVMGIEPESLKRYQKNKLESLSPKTVNGIIERMHTIFQYALDNGKVKNIDNPFSKINRLKIDNARERYLSTDEIKRLLEITKVKDYEVYIFCLLSLNTGGRLETVYNIKPHDIVFEHSMVTLKDFKTNSTYKGFLSPQTLEILSEHIQKNKKIFTSASSTLRHRTQWFLEEFNEGIDDKDTKNRVVVHTLRHTFASHLAIQGTPIYTIQKLMNHLDIKSTLRYAKLAPDFGKEAIKRLGDTLF